MNVPATPLNHSTRIYVEMRSRIAAAYELADDDPVLLDTLEGISDLHERIAAVLREAKANEAMAEGIADLLDQMKSRKARLQAGAMRLRHAALWAMQEAGLAKLSAPDMTVSVSPGRPRLVIDETRLPSEFKMEFVSVKPDLEKVQASVDVGDVPEGVQIANPQPFLTIRTR